MCSNMIKFYWICTLIAHWSTCDHIRNHGYCSEPSLMYIFSNIWIYLSQIKKFLVLTDQILRNLSNHCHLVMFLKKEVCTLVSYQRMNLKGSYGQGIPMKIKKVNFFFFFFQKSTFFFLPQNHLNIEILIFKRFLAIEPKKKELYFYPFFNEI